MRKRHFFIPFLIIGCIMISANLSAQENDSIKPEIHWDVNREYDENGNILRYDSTFTYYWKSPGMDDFNCDSLLSNFPSFFWKGPHMNHLYFDSLYSEYLGSLPDYFDEGFFFKFPFGYHPFIFHFSRKPDLVANFELIPSAIIRILPL